MKASTWLTLLSVVCFISLLIRFWPEHNIPVDLVLIPGSILMVSFICGAIERATDSICACIVKRNLTDELIALNKKRTDSKSSISDV